MTAYVHESSPLYISESDVAQLIDVGKAVEALQSILELQFADEAENLEKTHVGWGDGSILHALGGVAPTDGFCGTKTWAYTKRGANPLLVLFDAEHGALRAIIEAGSLGALRTGAISGVATHWMAAPGPADFAIIGTGRQALTQAAAVAAVRECRSVRVYSRSRDNRLAFCETLQERVGVTAEPSESVESALDGANIITLVTRSPAPFLSAKSVADGTHVNAVGAIVRSYAEFEPDLLARCGYVTADSVPAVRNLSREFREFYGDDEDAWERVTPLSRIAAARSNVFDRNRITLFKSMGMGLSDLALGIRVYREALVRGIGLTLEKTRFTPPNYRALTVTL